MPITLVLELEWVLRVAYKLPRDAVINAFEGLLAFRQLYLEQEDLVRWALDWHQQGMEFTDDLHLARSGNGGWTVELAASSQEPLIRYNDHRPPASFQSQQAVQVGNCPLRIPSQLPSWCNGFPS